MSPGTLDIFPVNRAVDDRFNRISVLVILILTALRIVALYFNRTDLFVDESQYWSWSQALDWGYYSKPPLIAFIIAATTSLFGNEEWAVRLAAPLFHGGTSLILLTLGTRLYGGRAGGWAGLLFLTLPAVSLSSTLISTDPPLLFFWSLALLALVRLLQSNSWFDSLFFAAAVALGVNAKYAMLFILPLVPLALTALPPLRSRLRSPQLWFSLLLSLSGLIPNAIWNARHDFATLRHTSDNAHWTGSLFHPMSAAEFLASQAGVFGPILLIVFGLAIFGKLKSPSRDADRFLIFLSLPVLLIFTVQAFLSRANANWAATAYPAATLLVAGILDPWTLQRWRRLTIALHGLVAAILLIAPAYAPQLSQYGLGNPFARILGIRAAMSAISAKAGETPTLVFARRSDTAAALYYLRGTRYRIVTMVDPTGIPQDHFQLTRPFTTKAPSPGLFIAPMGIAPPSSTSTGGPSVTMPVAKGVSEDGKLILTPVFW